MLPLITLRSFSLKTRDDFLFLRSAFPINFYRIRAKKYKQMRVMKNKGKFKTTRNCEYSASSTTPVFFGLTCVFPTSYKHFKHVGMLQLITV